MRFTVQNPSIPLGAMLVPSVLGVGVWLSFVGLKAAKAQPPKRAVVTPAVAAPILPGIGVDLAPDPFTPSVKVFVRNRGKEPITSRIVLSNPDNFLGAARSIQTVDVPASGETQAKFSLPGAAMAPDSRYSFTAEVKANPAPPPPPLDSSVSSESSGRWYLPRWTERWKTGSTLR